MSEAMHALRVPSTRALSLTVSATEHSTRPWTLDKNTKVGVHTLASTSSALIVLLQSSALAAFLRERYPPQQWVSMRVLRVFVRAACSPVT